MSFEFSLTVSLHKVLRSYYLFFVLCFQLLLVLAQDKNNGKLRYQDVLINKAELSQKIQAIIKQNE